MSEVINKFLENSERTVEERESLILVVANRLARLYSGENLLLEEEVSDFDKYWKSILLNEELNIEELLGYEVSSADETVVVLMEGKMAITPELLHKILEENNVKKAESIVRAMLPKVREKPPVIKPEMEERIPILRAPSIEVGEENVEVSALSFPVTFNITLSVKDPSILRSVVKNALQDGFEVTAIGGKKPILIKQVKYGEIRVEIDYEKLELTIQYEDHFFLRLREVTQRVLKTLLSR
jgi:hypothetical protein